MPQAEEELRERPIEVGDAFAIPASLDAVAAAAEHERPVEVTSWIKGPVVDVTADAREAAKLVTLRALAPPLDPETQQRLLADAPDMAPPLDPEIQRGLLADLLDQETRERRHQ